jgi:type I restriction enzyme, S subunit
VSVDGELVYAFDRGAQLPDNWRVATLADVVNDSGIFCDGDWVESKDQDPGGDVRLIQLADIGVGSYRDRSDRFLTSDRAMALSCTYNRATFW